MTKICPTCGQVVPTASDAAIVRALIGGNVSKVRGQMKLIPHMLYASADPRDTRRADLNRWFVTGPMDRADFVRGPFPHSQVLRIARTGAIVPDYTGDDGTVHTYVKAEHGFFEDPAHTSPAAAQQGRHEARTKSRA